METEKIEQPKQKTEINVRMKEYESISLTLTTIAPHFPFIVRLDGHCFSKFTSGLQKPFDLNLTKAMIQTTSDLLIEFSGVTGYTHSDEITIIFRHVCTKEETMNPQNKFNHIFDGRVIKLLTLMSSFCSVRFNYHFIKIINQRKELYKESYVEKVNESKVSFDARLVIFPEGNEEEIVNHMVWRSLFDCERNAVSTYARTFFSQKQIDKKGKLEMINMLKEKGINWEKTEGEGTVPMILKHGCYLKRKKFEVEINEKYGKIGEKAMRTKVVVKTLKIKLEEFYYKLMLDKFWELKENEKEELEVEKIKDIGTIDIDKIFN